MIRTTTAITRRIWINPPMVYELTSPSSQSTSTASLALLGTPVEAVTALKWGLVDEIQGGP